MQKISFVQSALRRLVRAGQPQMVASAPNQQWAIDFVHDRLARCSRRSSVSKRFMLYAWCWPF
jgi:hypothetical protein